MKLFYSLLTCFCLLLVCGCNDDDVSPVTGDPDSLENGRIAHFAFNGDANDAQRGFYASVYPDNFVADRHGFPASAIYFPGDISLQVTDGTPFSFGVQEDFAFAFWMKKETETRAAFMLAKVELEENSGAEANYALLMADIEERLLMVGYFGLLDDDECSDQNGDSEEAAAILGSDGSWQHIVFQRTTGSNQLWVDGELQIDLASGQNSSCPVENNGPLFIGGVYRDFFTGALDDLIVWNRSLTEMEIKQLAL